MGASPSPWPKGHPPSLGEGRGFDTKFKYFKTRVDTHLNDTRPSPGNRLSLRKGGCHPTAGNLLPNHPPAPVFASLTGATLRYTPADNAG